jgi:flagellar biosynthetic protein FlhB
MVDPLRMTGILGASFSEAASILLPVMLTVTVLALLAMFIQVGPLFTLEPIKPSLNKLNPISGLQRMFSARAFVQLAMGIAKMSLLTGIAWWTLRGRMDELAGVAALHLTGVLAVISEVTFDLGLRLAIALLILAILDFSYQKYRTYQDLKMTKEEVREELKRMDGDPHIKRRRREVQMQLSLQRIRSAVPRADVVITNPTEIAVAIQYDSDRMAAPKVVAKGGDYLAMRIRELAIIHGIPIVERKPLARALYREVEVGQEVPPHFYKAIAEILAYVYELAGKNDGRRAAASMN